MELAELLTEKKDLQRDKEVRVRKQTISIIENKISWILEAMDECQPQTIRYLDLEMLLLAHQAQLNEYTIQKKDYEGFNALQSWLGDKNVKV